MGGEKMPKPVGQTEKDKTDALAQLHAWTAKKDKLPVSIRVGRNNVQMFQAVEESIDKLGEQAVPKSEVVVQNASPEMKTAIEPYEATAGLPDTSVEDRLAERVRLRHDQEDASILDYREMQRLRKLIQDDEDAVLAAGVSVVGTDEKLTDKRTKAMEPGAFAVISAVDESMKAGTLSAGNVNRGGGDIPREIQNLGPEKPPTITFKNVANAKQATEKPAMFHLEDLKRRAE